jgi:hypothetical protein
MKRLLAGASIVAVLAGLIVFADYRFGLRDALFPVATGACGSHPSSSFELPDYKGLNYGTPPTVSGAFVGTRWLRASEWPKVEPALKADVDFIAQNELGRVVRLFVGLDQAMIWDERRGFLGYDAGSLDRFQTALDLFQARGIRLIVVLFDDEEASSPGNFRSWALDGAHSAMRNNYLRAVDAFLRRFGSSPVVAGWDLFNEPYNSIGRRGETPGQTAGGFHYADSVVHNWLRDLYRVARCAAPGAWFTASDTTDLYWHSPPDVSLYADVVDFYDMHVYDDNPRVRDWRAFLHKPYLLGEVAASVENEHYRDQALNSRTVRFMLEHGATAGVSAVLAQAPDGLLFPSDRRGLTATGLVLACFDDARIARRSGCGG